MAIKITGLFKPGGNFPLIEDIDILGGFRVVDKTTDRDNINDLNKKAGMITYVKEEGKFYQLEDDLTNWVEIRFGNPNIDGWEGEVDKFDDLPDPNDHIGEQWLVQNPQGSWLTFDRKKAGLYESRDDDGDGNFEWVYLGVKIHKVTEEEKTQCIEEIRRFSVKDVCDIAENHNLWKEDNSSTGLGKIITPKDDEVQRIYLKREKYGFSEVCLVNTNNTDNYAGATFVASINGEDYKDQVFLTMYNDSFYQSYLKGKGANLTDRQLVLGAYGDNAELDIAFGNNFTSINPYVKITPTKFDLVNKSQPIYYTYGKETKNYDKQDNILVCNSATRVVKSLPFTPITKQYVMYGKGVELSDNNIWFFKKPIIPDISSVKVYVNGNLTTNWQFDYHYQNRGGYIAHIKFNSNLNDDDIIKLTYIERESLFDVDIRLIRLDSNGNEVKDRNAMITKTINHHQNGFMYLKDVSSPDNTKTAYDCVYSTPDDSKQVTIKKRYFTHIWIGNFSRGDTLSENYEIEVWGMDRKANFVNSGNSGNLSLSPRNSFILLHKTNKNLIDIFNDLQAKSNYILIRIRKSDGNGGYYFSPFSSIGVSIKRFPIFSTNATLTMDEYKGTYYMTMLC